MIRVFNKMDKPLLILSIFMFIFGLFMILDASSMKSFLNTGEKSETSNDYVNKYLSKITTKYA